MNAVEIISEFKTMKNPVNIKGMARFGIVIDNAFGINIPYLRNLAKQIKFNHELALELWALKYHEAKLLATMIENPKLVTETQMENWVLDFYSWDICDQCCSNLFKKTPFAYIKAKEWTTRPEEFVKRAGFVLMACLAVADKKENDEKFIEFLTYIYKERNDTRNFVRKAINWALRQIGKRNLFLHQKSIEMAQQIAQNSQSTYATWIASDALKELNDYKIISRIKNKKA